MKIKVLIPNAGMDRPTLDSRERMLAGALSSDCAVSVDCIERGPGAIESNTDEVLAGAELLRRAVMAEKDGFDAVVIYCFSDLAIDAIRENVSIPVIGPGEITLAVASMLSVKFAVITTASKNLPRTLRRISKNPACRAKLARVRPLDIPVADLRKDPRLTLRYLHDACVAAVSEDGVDTVVLGCLGFAEYGRAIEDELGISVLDPSFIAVAYAEMCVRVGIRHNRRANPRFEHTGALFESGEDGVRT